MPAWKCGSVLRRVVGLGCVLALWIAPTVFAQSTCITQSPRVMDRWNILDGPPTIERGATQRSVKYTPPGGAQVELHVCSQHYHCWIENLQPLCPDQHATEVGGPPDQCPKIADLHAGSWVEVHTVYSLRVADVCTNPESLECCTQGPFVVLGYHARIREDDKHDPVEAGVIPMPVPSYWSLPAAEWSGSNTDADKCPGECKPIAAKWRFNLECNTTLGRGQLGLFSKGDRARGLQPSERLSSDLNHITH